ncbi:MAG: trehalose-phosphatase [Deltaproteobacteria bacterium]|nr:trehalose-phosphatase [Deltaproteobacteria bacterium]
MRNGVGRSIWIFDFDGTLSNLVEDRRAARLDEGCRRMLEELVSRAGDVVAVISSRHIDDIARRVDVPGVLVGGGSGVVWRSGDAVVISPPPELVDELSAMRKVFLPVVRRAAARFPGVDIEEKEWSLAIHVRGMAAKHKDALLSSLKSLPLPFEMAIYLGPRSIEIPFLARINKASGVRALCQHISFTSLDRLFYAGDDDNDLVAMALVRHLGGKVACLGTRAFPPECVWLSGPRELPRYVAALAVSWDDQELSADRVFGTSEADGFGAAPASVTAPETLAQEGVELPKRRPPEKSP